ncbi:MAG: hypothetical protein KDA55_14745 [Planctomycetales bacterium]|nr:hypothetical protein [Planctomycetales bacterium]
MYRALLFVVTLLCLTCNIAFADEPIQVSGIYPHLAMFNNENECGVGAVVPWAGRLWAITYGPHLPFGSSDKLYEVKADLEQIVRPESVGGTPANRLIHRETNQLLIGPYLIDADRQVRVLSPDVMPGRLTGVARHLTQPERRAFYATMEEGLYDVDLVTLEVKRLIRDGNQPRAGQASKGASSNEQAFVSKLPGYHGKGLYSGQGRLVYANNGEHGAAALRDPTTPSGALAEWRGDGDWQLVRRNQFTEVTGPGGIFGNPSSDTPIWSIGWDARSLILMLLDKGEWHAYRLPKASHCYDGAHGWNTEWPRIREIGTPDSPALTMTMPATFWKFPRTFSLSNTSGIKPRSTYLKVVGDFWDWGDRVVLGCDDTAKSEFLNKRKLKGEIAGPGQSQSNLWFVSPERLDQLGPAIGRGALWLNDSVEAGRPSEPYLFTGYDRRCLFLEHDGDGPIRFRLEVDHDGNGTWKTLREVSVAAKTLHWAPFSATDVGTWIRIVPDVSCRATAFFHYSDEDRRPAEADSIFSGIAKPDEAHVNGGIVYARGANLRTLRFVAEKRSGDRVESLGCYDLDASLNLAHADDPTGEAWARKNFSIPENVLTVDAASVLYVDEDGNRWRLPKGDPAFDEAGPFGPARIDREVCTERDLLNCHGTFYELPARNAGGFAKVRPIATHNRRIQDYASYRGLLVMSGMSDDAPETNSHIIRSTDGHCALWVGAVDDLWKFGKPRGAGGPWFQSDVVAGQPSDPYLMTGYDRKHLTLTHSHDTAVTFELQVDYTGTGQWATYQTLHSSPNEKTMFEFPDAFAAYWIRLVPSHNCQATATFVYE